MESFVYLLFIILSSAYCQEGQGLVYYVTATGTDCPLVHQQYCQSLNDYANQSHWSTVSNNVTFLFLPGEHSFKGKFKIKGVSYVTLRGIESQFESRAMINCEEVKINSVSILFIESLKIANLTMLIIENTTEITVSKISSQTLSISVSSSVTILQSEFIANSPLTMVHLTHISDTIFIQDVVVVSSRIGTCFYSFISPYDNFTFTLKDSIIICWDHSGIYISSSVIKESSKSFLEFSNVTLGSNDAIAQISVHFTGNIMLTDVKIFNASGVTLSSEANPIFLERVYFTNSATGLLIRAYLGHVYFTDVSLMNTGGLHIGYCDLCYFKHLKVSNGTNGIIVNSAKTSVTLINCTITNNSNTGFRIKGQAEIIFAEHPSRIFDNASPDNGGGLWISQGITISFIARVSFARNVAKGVGGAIYVDNDPLSNNKDRDCTLKYKHKITSYFWDNYGELGGNDIYGGFYWDCCYKPFGTNCKKVTSSDHLFRKQLLLEYVVVLVLGN
uniref:Right handed beta helix domain-containing protein n=1 Tax=Amphimedon queenslandica TaxID=400682 RepID=A0A1X7VPV1_AMPQE